MEGEDTQYLEVKSVKPKFHREHLSSTLETLCKLAPATDGGLVQRNPFLWQSLLTLAKRN